MSEANEQLLAQLKTLIPINELPPNLQTRLFDRAQILEVKKSRFIFKQGDKDNYSYYLLDGEVELHTNNQLDSIIQSTADRAKYALAQLQPRQFSAKAKTTLKILQIDRTVMDQLLLLAQEATVNPMLREPAEMKVDEVDGVDDDGDWMTQMLQSELFARMPMANMHQLFALLEPVDKKAGEVVIQQGEPGEHYYIVSEGRCAVSRKPSPKSSDVKLAELKTGDSFGEEALISNSTRNATITMITDGSLMRLAKDTFIELIKKPTLQSLSFSDAKVLVENGAQWLDVRFPNEHQESSIKDSINIPLNSIRLQIDKLDETRKYILFCDTAGRSSTGAFLLAERGFDVSFLEGGLLNNSEAVGVKAVIPEAPKAKAKKAVQESQAPALESEVEEVDAEVRVEMLNAGIETTQIQMQVAEEKSKEDDDAKKKKELKEAQRNLQEAKKKLEAEKLVAEAEAKKKAATEELKLKKLTQEAEKKMQVEKKQLEEIYSKNAKEMQKLQEAKEEAEGKMRKEREKLEQQAAAAKQQLEAAERIKKEVEASKKLLEEQAGKNRLEEEAREKKLQIEAKAKIEEERKKLADQYARNNQEFEDLQKEKAATEAARKAAKEEAENIIREYKMSHDKTRVEEEAKLKAERLKLEEEAKKIQETMKLIQQAKLDAEKIKQEAIEQASALKEKQMDSTSSKEQRAKLEVEIKVAEEKAVQAERELEDVVHKEKITESVQQENQADLDKKKKEEEALLAKIQNDLVDFEDKQQEESASITQIQMTTDHMKRIKEKAAQAKRKAASSNSNLLDEISKQLGKD